MVTKSDFFKFSSKERKVSPLSLYKSFSRSNKKVFEYLMPVTLTPFNLLECLEAGLGSYTSKMKLKASNDENTEPKNISLDSRAH